MTREELAAAGFVVSDDAYARLEQFVAALLDENRTHNLTGIREPAGVWALHVCDSLALLPLIDEARPARLLDLGTGGGIPGIPLACVRADLQVTLLDATRKKVDAARRIAAAVGVTNVSAVWGRAEELAKTPPHRAHYDVVVARAVARMPELLGFAAGLVRPGGLCWFMKSVRAAEEEVAATRTIGSKLRLEHVETRRYRLPDPHGERAFVVYRKRVG